MQTLLLTEVLSLCRAGDHAAAAELVRRFQGMAYTLASALVGDAHLAQDAAQESFVRALASLPDLRDDRAFPGWFRQILRSECHRINRQRASPAPIAAEVVSPAPTPPDDALRAESRALVRAALAALPHAGRETAELFYLDERSCSQIAQTLGVPEGTVKRRLHDARQKLRESLFSLGEPDRGG